MKNHLRKVATTALILIATTTSFSLAASNNTQKPGQKPPQSQNQQMPKNAPRPGQPQNQSPQQNQPQAHSAEVSYYDGDPLNGGNLLKTETLQLDRQPGQKPFFDAPTGTKFVVVTDDRGSHIIDLSKAPQPGDFDGHGGRQEGPWGGNPDDNRGERGGPQGDWDGNGGQNPPAPQNAPKTR